LDNKWRLDIEQTQVLKAYMSSINSIPYNHILTKTRQSILHYLTFNVVDTTILYVYIG